MRIVTDPKESDDGVRRPCDEPKGDHTEHDGGKFQLLLVLVLIRLDAVCREHDMQDVRVTIGDGEEGHAPGANKVTEHENPSVPIVRQVVEAAASQVSFRHVAAEYFQQRYSGEEEGVEPTDEDHESGLPKGRCSIRIQRIDNHVKPVDCDSGQCGYGDCPSEGSHESVNLATCEGEE